MLKSGMKLFAVGILLATFTTPSVAIPVEWTFNNAVYADGSFTTGSFTYDADTDTYDMTNTTTHCFSTCGGETVTNWDYVDGNPYGVQFDSHPNGGPMGLPVIQQLMYWTEDLRTAGNVVAIHQGQIRFDGSDVFYNTYLNPGATISAVPVPAAVWLFASGLGQLGWIRRRRTA